MVLRTGHNAGPERTSPLEVVLLEALECCGGRREERMHPRRKEVGSGGLHPVASSDTPLVPEEGAPHVERGVEALAKSLPGGRFSLGVPLKNVGRAITRSIILTRSSPILSRV